MTRKTPIAPIAATAFADGAGLAAPVRELRATARYLNPLPVAVMLVPVDGGLLVVRRGITPGLGELALPGGYIGLGETWQEAGAREVWEETGLRLDPAEIQRFHGAQRAGGHGADLRPRRAATATDLPPFEPNTESTERLVIPAPTPLAFPLHTRRWTHTLPDQAALV